MGRILCGVALAFGLAATTPAFADQITQVLPVGEGGDELPFDIRGATFDPSLGTLESVSARLFGWFSTSISAPDNPGPSVIHTNVDWFFEEGVNSEDNLSGVTGPITLSCNLYNCKGYAVAPVDVSVTFPDASPFVGDGQNTTVGGFGVFANVFGLIGGAWDADLMFNSIVTLTYDYAPVPEPASYLLFGCGAFLTLVVTGWRAGRSSLSLRNS